jgi:hypothetical protein
LLISTPIYRACLLGFVQRVALADRGGIHLGDFMVAHPLFLQLRPAEAGGPEAVALVEHE